MKSYHIISSALCLMAASSAFAQDYTDALRFNSNDLLGTARSQYGWRIWCRRCRSHLHGN